MPLTPTLFQRLTLLVTTLILGGTALIAISMIHAQSSCGDSQRDQGEQCDDGNTVDDDRCSNSCRLNLNVYSRAQAQERILMKGNQQINYFRCPENASSTIQLNQEIIDRGSRFFLYESTGNERCNVLGQEGDPQNCQGIQKISGEINIFDGSFYLPPAVLSFIEQNFPFAFNLLTTVRSPLTHFSGVSGGSNIVNPSDLKPGDYYAESAVDLLLSCSTGVIRPAYVCGNDVVEGEQQYFDTNGALIPHPAEACDDGNQIDDDGCTNACTLPACGDGIVQAGEACDGDSDCTNLCTVISSSQEIGHLAIDDFPVQIVVDGQYAYVVTLLGHRFLVVDISDPAHPRLVGEIAGRSGAGELNEPHAIRVSGTYAYVSSLGNDTLSVIDISNAANPILVSSINTADHPQDIEIQGNYLYIAAATDSAIEIIDITNPLQPQQFASIAHEPGVTAFYNVNNLSIQGTLLFAVASLNDTLTIFDISNPQNPQERSVLDVSHDNNPATFDYIDGLVIQGNYAYISQRETRSFSVIDISNTQQPQRVGMVNLPEGSVKQIRLDGTTAYGVGGNNLFVIDVSNPTSPVIIKNLQDDSFDGDAAYLHRALSLDIDDAYIYTISLQDGLAIFQR